MTVSITNWYTAGAQLNKIREACEAFQRGDQPEKIDHFAMKEIKELFLSAEAIVAFCAASLGKRSQSQLEFRDHETYRYARSYGKTMARVLLHRGDVGPGDRRRLEKWLATERDLPSIRIAYV